MRVFRRLLCSSGVESDERRVTVDVGRQLNIKERTDAGPAAVEHLNNRTDAQTQASTDTQRLVDSGVGWAEQMLQQVPFVTCVLDITGNSLLYCGGVPPASAALASDCLYHILGGDADAVEEVLQCTDRGLVWQGSLLGRCLLQRQLSSNSHAADTNTHVPLHALTLTDSTGTCSSQARLVQLNTVVMGSCSQEATQSPAAALQVELALKPGHADQSSPGQLSNLPNDGPGRCSGAKRTSVRWANSSNAQPVSAFMFAKQLKDPAAGGSPGRPTPSLPQPACSPGSSLEGSSSVQTGAGCSVARTQRSLNCNHSLSFAHQPRMSTSGTTRDYYRERQHQRRGAQSLEAGASHLHLFSSVECMLSFPSAAEVSTAAGCVAPTYCCEHLPLEVLPEPWRADCSCLASAWIARQCCAGCCWTEAGMGVDRVDACLKALLATLVSWHSHSGASLTKV
ncbi:hypothetical protein HaLaN_27494 [Haematococcus lacustris]|uniref:Uncharacterized protein n=1 Tax=Haematococcus lacustris TaxID=44745 RepID=A0A6A0A8I5_HAELA|nr:hypothetical protein HaLaN_27494 [Haematococcus lacustris]